MNQADAIFQNLTGALRAIPLGVYAIPIAGVVLGLVLWLWGGKMLRPMSVVLGLAAGSLCGALFASSAGLQDVGGVPGPWIGLAAGAFAGLCLGLVLFRFSMGLAAAGVIGAAAFVGSIAYLSNTGQLPASARSEERAAQAAALGTQMRDSFGDLRITARRRSDPPAAQDPGESGTDAERSVRMASLAANARAFAGDLSNDVVMRWDAMTPRARLVLFGGTFAGLIVGLAAGLAWAKKTAALVTAFAGAALWIACGMYLLRVGGVSIPDAVAERPLWWAVAWIAVSIAGVTAQLIRRKPGEGQPSAA